MATPADLRASNYAVLTRPSPTTGNTEVWAGDWAEDSTKGTLWGSLVRGGLNTSSNGATKRDKNRKGYEDVPGLSRVPGDIVRFVFLDDPLTDQSERNLQEALDAASILVGLSQGGPKTRFETQRNKLRALLSQTKASTTSTTTSSNVGSAKKANSTSVDTAWAMSAPPPTEENAAYSW